MGAPVVVPDSSSTEQQESHMENGDTVAGESAKGPVDSEDAIAAARSLLRKHRTSFSLMTAKRVNCVPTPVGTSRRPASARHGNE